MTQSATCLDDIAVDSRANPHLLQVLLKQSKTDPFKQGVKVHLGATNSLVCPVKAVLSYLHKRSTRASPLFITSEGKGWTRRMFCASLKSELHNLKLDQHSYNTHSFRIGVTTSAFLAQFLDTHIQILGR